MEIKASWPPELSPPREPPPPPPPPLPFLSPSGLWGLIPIDGLPDCPGTRFDDVEMLVLNVVGPGATANGVVESLSLVAVLFLVLEVTAGSALDKMGVSNRRVPLSLVTVAPGTMVLRDIFWLSSAVVVESSVDVFEDRSVYGFVSCVWGLLSWTDGRSSTYRSLGLYIRRLI